MYGIKEFKKPYSKTVERYDMSNFLDWISYTIKISDPDNIPNFAYHGDTPLGKTWGIVYVNAPNVATLLDDSNWDQWVEEFNKLDSDCERWHIEYFSSWITGTDNLMIQLITDDGIPTEESKLAYKLLTQLQNYPILNDEDYSKREYESSLESIRDYARYSSDFDSDTLPKDYEYLIWRELDDSNIYSIEGYFSDDDLYAAFSALGYINDEDSEENSD